MPATALFAFPRKTGKARDNASLTIRYGSQTMKLTLKVQGSYRLTHAVTPDVPPKMRDSLYIEQDGTQATFTTIWEPANEH